MKNDITSQPGSAENVTFIKSELQEPCQKIVEHCLAQIVANLSPAPPEKSETLDYFAEIAREDLGSVDPAATVEGDSRSEKPAVSSGAKSPLMEAFSFYLDISGKTKDAWIDAVRGKSGNPVLMIEIFQLLSMAVYWRAIETCLDWDYGEEFTLSVMASRKTLWRIDRILKGETLIMPTPMELLRMSD